MALPRVSAALVTGSFVNHSKNGSRREQEGDATVDLCRASPGHTRGQSGSSAGLALLHPKIAGTETEGTEGGGEYITSERTLHVEIWTGERRLTQVPFGRPGSSNSPDRSHRISGPNLPNFCEFDGDRE